MFIVNEASFCTHLKMYPFSKSSKEGKKGFGTDFLFLTKTC